MRAAKDRAKVGGFTAPLNLNYTTRASISHEKAEQIRARKPARPLDNGWRGREFSLCADGMESISFILSVGCAWALCVGRWLAAAVKNHKETFLIVFFSLVRKERKGQKEESFDSCLGDADTHAPRMCQFPTGEG